MKWLSRGTMRTLMSVVFMFALCGFGAQYEPLKVDKSTDDCTQNVNFTGTVTIGGSGIVVVSGVASGDLAVYDGVNWTILSASAVSGQAILSDGAGNLAWGDVSVDTSGFVLIDGTRALTGNWDVGAFTITSDGITVNDTLTISSSTTTTPNSVGELHLDTDGAGNITQGVLGYHDGTQVMYVLGIDTLTTTDGYVPYYSSATGKLEWKDAGASTRYETVWVDSSAMIAQDTSGPSVGYAENVDYATIDHMEFSSGSAEYAQVRIGMPDGWDLSTLRIKISWTTESGIGTSGDVVWRVEAASVADGEDPTSATWGSSGSVTDSVGTAGLLQVTSAFSVTVGGTPAKDEVVWFRLSRRPESASDTLAAPARLVGMKIQLVNDGGSAW